MKIKMIFAYYLWLTIAVFMALVDALMIMSVVLIPLWLWIIDNTDGWLHYPFKKAVERIDSYEGKIIDKWMRKKGLK